MQADLLDALRCDQLQGYFIGKPVSAAEVVLQIAGGEPARTVVAQQDHELRSAAGAA
jgi:EAL domain-containing protein (putative c-di-GMP-specific phosphodiesterase class I)